MVRFERTRRMETQEQDHQKRTVDIEEDTYTIEADTAGEICVTIQTVERERGTTENGK